MKSRVFLALIVATPYLLLNACGSGKSGSAVSGNAVASSQSCLGSACHASTVSLVTGRIIADEWKSSIHYRMNAAGCADCHEGSHNNGNKCGDCHGGKIPTSLDVTEKCGRCHGLDHPEDRLATKAPQHFGPLSTAKGDSRWLNKDRAEYVSSRYVGNCRKCHNPHDTSSTFSASVAWAQSGHGDVWAGARTSRDFKMFGTVVPANRAMGTSPSFTGTAAQKQADTLAAGNSNTVTINNDPNSLVLGIPITFTPACVRCHTTTGFIKFVNSGFSDITPFGNSAAGSYDYSKEVTGCNACHDDGLGNAYSFKLRTVPPVRIYYNISTTRLRAATAPATVKVVNIPTDYPDFGSSNMCAACHAGRGKGGVIKLMAQKSADPDALFQNVGSPSAHDFAGAATLGKKIGFEFYSSYRYENNDACKHDEIGLASSGARPSGPCITCHLGSENPADSHRFEAVKHGEPIPFSDVATRPYSVSSSSPASLLVTEVATKACRGCHSDRTPAFLNDKKTGYISSLAVLKYWVGLVVTTSGKWDNLGAGTGPKTMGASFNNGYLQNEPGAYVHSPLYARRLIYDSLDWLKQYPANPQSSVFNAVSTATNTVGKTQVNAAIKWIYGKNRNTLTAAEKVRRPGD